MRNIIRLTNDFILKNGIHSLPLGIEELGKICESLGYRLFSYSQSRDVIRALGVESLTAYSAFVHQSSTANIIFFDERLSTSARNFVIAHEIGHITLRHNYVGSIGFTGANNEQEKEANTFALQLLAPLCILNALDVRSVRDIQTETLLDRKRAKVVLKRLRTYEDQPRAEEMIIAYGVRHVKHRTDWQGHLLSWAVIAAACLCLIVQHRTIADLEEQLASQAVLSQFRPSAQKIDTPAVTTNTAEPIPAYTVPLPDTVFVTSGGTRYHTQDCYHIKNSTAKSLTRTAAESGGYTPCKTCYK